MLQTVCGEEGLSRSSVFESFKRLKTDVRIVRIIQKTGVLQPLEMQTQSQITVKWCHEITDGLSEWWRMN
jgi:hypothetical protein